MARQVQIQSHTARAFAELGKEKRLQEYSNIIFQLLGLVIDFISAEGETLRLSRGVHFNPYCVMLRKTPSGSRACAECDVANARKAASLRESICYSCYAGLTEIIYPLFDAHGTYIGSMTAGQFHLGERPLLTRKEVFELARMVIRGIKDYPALLFYGFDEPELYTKLPQEKVRQLFDLIKQEDPNHIVSINLCQHWRFKDFVYSDIASYDNYPYPACGLMEIVNLNRKIHEARPGRPLVSFMQTFNYDGMPVPPLDFLCAELFVNIIDNSCGISAYAGDEFRRCMLNEPELQAGMKLVCHMDREIDRTSRGVKRETVKVKATHAGFSAQKRGNLFLLVNYSDAAPCRMEIPCMGKHAEDMFDPDRIAEVKNGILRITLPPYGVAALKVK